MFNAAFNGGFAETKTQTCTVPEDDPTAFGLLLGWVYRGGVNWSSDQIFELEDDIETLTYLIGLATKYDLPTLSQSALKLIQGAFSGANRKVRKVSWYKLAWELTPEGSDLRNYHSKRLAHGLAVYRERKALEKRRAQMAQEKSTQFSYLDQRRRRRESRSSFAGNNRPAIRVADVHSMTVEPDVEEEIGQDERQLWDDILKCHDDILMDVMGATGEPNYYGDADSE